MEETARERQSRVVKAGGNWEEYVRIYLNECLEGTGIEVIIGKLEDEVKMRSYSLWESLTMPLKSSKKQGSIWGDIDLIAIREDLPIAVISCKTSLHGRFTETLFWSILFKTLTRTRVVLATPDSGRGSGNTWKSEWGTLKKPTKDRLLAESYLEAVYVENLKEYCKFIKPGQGTVLGGIIRPLSQLPKDIERWSEDILKVYMDNTQTKLI
ncbi:hypothetical protein ES703_49543 [subsurface metagenome]